MNLFSPNSKFTQVMTSLGEMMLLNLCWILGSLPLVTVGAANAAMYVMMGRRLRGEGTETVRPFFKAWRNDLGTGSFFWIVQLLVTVSLGLILFLPLHSLLRVLAVVLLVLVTLVFSVIYPQIARFRNRRFAYLRNSLILLVLRPVKVIQNLLILLLPLILFLLAPVLFLRSGVLWILFGISGIFYLSARVCREILQPLEDLSHAA